MTNALRVKPVSEGPRVRVKGLSSGGLIMSFFVRFERGTPIVWPLIAGDVDYVALRSNDIASITALKSYGITVSYLDAYGNKYAYIRESALMGYDVEFLRIFNADGVDVTGAAKLTRGSIQIMDIPSLGFSSNIYRYPVYTVTVKFSKTS